MSRWDKVNWQEIDDQMKLRDSLVHTRGELDRIEDRISLTHKIIVVHERVSKVIEEGIHE